jgi:DNA-nicking Smr family endonuclease
MPRATLRDLRRGHYRVEAEIDLHGLTVRAATEQLGAFLERALVRNLRCVRIVHGKGLRSGTRGPVLRHAVHRLLAASPAVLAFVSAPAAQGGAGAVHVLLRR